MSIVGKCKSVTRPPSALSVLGAMVFWGQMQNYMMRGCLAVLIVAMVTTMPGETKPDFEWTEWERGLLLAAFNYGYITTQIIGGRLAEVIGFKRVYGFSLGSSALLTLVTPLVAKTNFHCFFALRVLLGICEGATFPTLYVITNKWVPPVQRCRFMARNFFGTNIGVLLASPLCGFIADSLGWEAGFYIIGCVSVLWFVLFCFLVYETPEDHPRISQEEKETLIQELRGSGFTEQKPPFPLKDALTSLPYLSIVATDIMNCVGLYVNLSQGPTYLKFMLGYSMTATGALTAAPPLCRYLGGIFFAQVGERLLEKDKMSVLTMRKVFNSISQFGPAALFIAMAYYGDSATVYVTLQCLSYVLNSALCCGHFPSFIDVAPNFAGTLMGMSNTFSGGAMGFIVPTAIGAITNNNMTMEAWKIVFLTTAACYAAGNVVYVLLVKADPQPWNYPKEEEEKRTESPDNSDEAEDNV